MESREVNSSHEKNMRPCNMRPCNVRPCNMENMIHVDWDHMTGAYRHPINTRSHDLINTAACQIPCLVNSCLYTRCTLGGCGAGAGNSRALLLHKAAIPDCVLFCGDSTHYFLDASVVFAFETFQPYSSVTTQYF